MRHWLIGLSLVILCLLFLPAVQSDMCKHRWAQSGYEFKAVYHACLVNIGGGWLPEQSVNVTHYRTNR